MSAKSMSAFAHFGFSEKRHAWLKLKARGMDRNAKKWLLTGGIVVAFVLAGTTPTVDGSSPFILVMPAAGNDYDVVPPGGPKEKGLRKPKLLSIRPHDPDKEKKKRKK